MPSIFSQTAKFRMLRLRKLEMASERLPQRKSQPVQQTQSSTFLMIMRACLLLIIPWLVTSAFAQSSPVPIPNAEVFKLTSEQFRNQSQVKQPIDSANIDFGLLAASIADATNQQRAKHGLSSLQYHGKVWQAAAIQAQAMAAGGFLSHTLPDQPTLYTPWDRVKSVGLDPRFVSENVATHFALQYESGKPFYKLTRDGKQIFSYTPDGPAIPPHTYLTFADTLVDAWLNSPEHRKNILSPEPKYLGCDSRPAAKTEGMQTFYCAQVFYDASAAASPVNASAPLGEGWRSLFNGRDLENWSQVGSARWRVENGVIVGGQEGDPKRSGLLATREQFQDFELRFEFMIDEHGKYNSGVYLRNDSATAARTGYQVNLGRAAAEEYCGGIFTDRWLAKGDEKDSVRRQLDWNQLHILAKGAHLEVTLNGVKVVDFTDPNPTDKLLQKGVIGFQTYGAEGHAGWVLFRNLYIRPLTSERSAR